ncbi:hypothetical protein [Dietzia psychralcaliphila]|uniref:Uncharacterized protein n=1 Tax=Dietzia psychralcaliphila TaxID=139021 RepID=A0AAD0NQF9_9ACTN|nr:hypothetical protein [Dietzia psychralcaliphila]AWH95954.1 hypothetical protein A6048_11075 [Dietzia psychralcaliphila]PTM85831.1 hypothetical protein C8N39_10911 [Dietzia psychralcaliphila]
MGRRLVIVRSSARKHGISDEDIRAALDTAVLSGPLDDDHPQRNLVLGFDTNARILELVALHYDDGTVEVIHAMKARRTYLNLLE